MSAIRKNSPPVGTIKKLPNGTEMKMTIRGWERVNPVLAKQKQEQKKNKQSKAEKASQESLNQVKKLRENNNGKAGLPRTNRA